MSTDTQKPRAKMNSTPGPGAVTRCYKATCAICRNPTTTVVVDAHDKETDAWPQLRDLGWRQTTRLTESDSKHWICPQHHESGSYKVYRDKENEHRIELEPGDVRGLGD